MPRFLIRSKRLGGKTVMMKSVLHQDDFNIELVDLWIHTWIFFFFFVFSTCFLPESTPFDP